MSEPDLTRKEEIEETTTCVQRLNKARGYLHFASGNAHAIGEHELAYEIDELRDSVEAFIDENFSEVPDEIDTPENEAEE